MKNTTLTETSPLNLLPVVLRARDFRLYTQGGGRLVDLWQCGGRSILGHNPAGVLRELKNSANRGLFSPLPHPLERRLVKALSRLIPRRNFRFYTERSALDQALEAAGFPRTESFPDPVFDPGADSGTLAGNPAGDAGPGLWRPFLEPAPEGETETPSPLLIPILPWPLAPWVLALEPALEDRFAPSQPVSPVLLAAAVRAVYDLIAAGPGGGRPVYPRINHALYGTPPGLTNPWRRRGPYLVYAPLQMPSYGDPQDHRTQAPPASWETLFRNFLREGFLIPPEPTEPLILPGTLSPGEEAKLAALLGPEKC
ncbi:MAG: hypothetical protein LBL56_00150 [Treponema sp.]|nr:hypothetical protein [Treponema sp.]